MKDIIIKYVNSLTKEDIVNFAKKENVTLSENDLEIIYTTIKKDYEVILNDDAEVVISKLKNKISEEAFDKIIELYRKYKKYI